MSMVPRCFVSRCSQKWSKSAPSASSGSLLSGQLLAGAGSYNHLCPSLRTWISPGWFFLGTVYRGNAATRLGPVIAPSDGLCPNSPRMATHWLSSRLESW